MLFIYETTTWILRAVFRVIISTVKLSLNNMYVICIIQIYMLFCITFLKKDLKKR